MPDELLPHARKPPSGRRTFPGGQRITWVSVAVNILLTLTQVVVGLLAHAQSLIADAMHTPSDLVADFFVLYANRRGSIPPTPITPMAMAVSKPPPRWCWALLLAGTGVAS